MRTRIHDPTATNNHNQVGHPYGRKPVGHQYRDRTGGAAYTARVVCVVLEEAVLRLRVERRRRFVEYQQERLVAHHGPPQRKLLPLAAGQLDASPVPLADMRGEPVIKALDDVVCAGSAQSLEDGGHIVDPGEVSDAHRFADGRLDTGEILEAGRQAQASLATGNLRTSTPSTSTSPELVQPGAPGAPR